MIDLILLFILNLYGPQYGFQGSYECLSGPDWVFGLYDMKFNGKISQDELDSAVQYLINIKVIHLIDPNTNTACSAPEVKSDSV